MEQEITEQPDALDQEEEVSDLNPETPAEEPVTPAIEELQEKLRKAEEVAKNQKIRAEKAEKLAKEIKPEPAPVEKQENMSVTDFYALTQNKVMQEDIQEIADYAKFKKISIADALKSSVIKNMLSEREEQRNVANATNINVNKRGPSKLSEEQILEKADRGEYPSDPAELAKARMAQKLKESAARKGN